MRTVLMVVRSGGGDVESEPVIVDTDAPDAVVLELDDGQRIELDASELRAALGEAA